MERKILKNIAFNSIKTLSTLIFPVLSFAYASRILLADGMGKIEYSKSWIAYFTILTMLGIVNYGTRECAKVRDDRKKLSKLASELLVLNICAMFLSYILLNIIILFTEQLSSYKTLLYINSISIFLTVIGMEWLYNAVEDFKYITIRTCLIQVVSFILLLVFVRNANDLWKYASIQVLSTTGGFLFNFFYSKKYIDIRINRKLKPFKHLKQVLILFIMIIAVQVFTHMDSTMLGWIKGSESVGYYTAATKLTSMLCSILVSCTIVLMPRIAYCDENSESNSISKISTNTLDLIMLFSIPMAIGVIMLSKNCILILSGQEYLPSVLATRILAIRVILSPLNTFIITHLFVAIRKENKMLIPTIFAALTNVVLNLVLIPQFAQNGAAVATVIAELIEFIITLFFLKKIVKIKSIFKNIWQYGLASMAIVIIKMIFDYLNINNIYLNSIVVTLLSILSYFIILYILKNEYVKSFAVKIRNTIKNKCFNIQ
ncbi:MAG: flippase [Clostridia bacterium]|nr:flippase [Clostridia bacterium]